MPTQRQGFVVSLELDLPVSILVGTTFNMYANDKMCGWSVALPWFNNWPPIVWSPYWRRLFCIKPQQGRTMVLGCKDWVARLFSSETIRLFRLVQPWLTMDFGAGSQPGREWSPELEPKFHLSYTVAATQLNQDPIKSTSQTLAKTCGMYSHENILSRIKR